MDSRQDELKRRLEERQSALERRIAERRQAIGQRLGDLDCQNTKGSGMAPVPKAAAAPGVQHGPRRMALCVGMDRIDESAYNGWDGALVGCIIDVLRFARIFEGHGVQTTVLENGNATIANVGQAMANAAEELVKDDVFMMVVSGHGGREDMGGRKHENWCLYDGCVWDEDIIAAFSRFRPGVKILLINDQCHSGGLFLEKSARPSRTRHWGASPNDRVWTAESAIKSASFPMLVQFAGCRAEQTSLAGSEGSTWSRALVHALEQHPDCSFRDWFDMAFVDKTLLRGRQDPQWVEKGPVTDAFRNGKVFHTE